jgi:hypothetical protein
MEEGRLMATKEDIARAIADLGVTGLRVSTFAGAAVVDDGEALGVFRAEALLGAAQTLLRGGASVQVGEDQARVRAALVRRAGLLVRGDEADRALHEKIVAEWTARSYRGPWRS